MGISPINPLQKYYHDKCGCLKLFLCIRNLDLCEKGKQPKMQEKKS